MCCGWSIFHLTSHHRAESQGFLSPEGGKHVKRQWALGMKNPWTSGRWINWFTQCYFTRDFSKQFQTLECLENMSPTWGPKQSSWWLKIHSVIWPTEGQSNTEWVWLSSRWRLWTICSRAVFIICRWCCGYNNNLTIITLLEIIFAPWLLNWFISWHFTNVEGGLVSGGSHFLVLWPTCTHIHRLYCSSSIQLAYSIYHQQRSLWGLPC